MTLPEIDHVSVLVEHAQTFFAGETRVGISLNADYNIGCKHNNAVTLRLGKFLFPV